MTTTCIMPLVAQTDAGILTLPHTPAAVVMPCQTGRRGRFYMDVNVTPNSTWTVDMRVYGRLSPEAPWFLIATITSLLPTQSLGEGTAYTCPTMPHMKVELHALHSTVSPIPGMGGAAGPGPWTVTCEAWIED